MRRQAEANYVPQYLTTLTETSSPNLPRTPPFNSSYTVARAPDRDAEPRGLPIPVIRKRAAVGGLRKRGFDIVAAGMAIILLLPLLCLIALAVTFSDRGPAIYRQRRIGHKGAQFSCLKFRTMVPNADAVLRSHLAENRRAASEWHACRKLKEDPRITPLGLVLRKTSLDELPQLFNILKGEMSLVGPRPVVAAELAKYGDSIEHYFGARPGLTGLWQVSGRNDVDYGTRVALDRRYVEEWSFRRDLLIIIKTSAVVLSSRGCY
jgi:exopolysaccharide production protein ExoY